VCWPYGSVASLVLACVCFPTPITSTLVRRCMDMDMVVDMDMDIDMDIPLHVPTACFSPVSKPFNLHSIFCCNTTNRVEPTTNPLLRTTHFNQGEGRYLRRGRADVLLVKRAIILCIRSLGPIGSLVQRSPGPNGSLVQRHSGPKGPLVLGYSGPLGPQVPQLPTAK
jgi:hypothetical protein